MTRNEYDYKRLEKQLLALKKKMDEKKEVIDKERDEMIISAVHEINISHEQAAILSKLIKDKKCFDEILKLDPDLKKNLDKHKDINESEDEDNEED